MRWIVHIGAQKAGSKSLQQFFVQHPDVLRAAGLHYPSAGRDQGVWHLPVYFELAEGKDVLLRQACDEVASSGAPEGLLSYEGFSALPDAALELLHQRIGAARIVLIMRRQDDWLSSWYNQVIKAHRMTFADIQECEQHLLSYTDQCDYAFIIARWAAVFGTENIVPLVYERGVSIVPSFFSALGCTIPEHALQASGSPDGHNFNPALSARGVSLLREIKRQVGDDPRLFEVVNAFHRQRRDCFVDTHRHGSQNFFTPEQRSGFLSLYDAANESIRARWFPDRDHLFAPDQDFTAIAVEPSGNCSEEAAQFLGTLGFH